MNLRSHDKPPHGMTEITTDERGRITIPKDLRDRFGDQYRVVELDDGIKLVPLEDDPVAALREAGSEELREASLSVLEAAAHEQADDETSEHVR